jgi:LVIVD repeat
MSMTNIVVAGSSNDNSFAVIDFSVPANPVKVLVTPPFQGGCMVDTGATLAVAGNFNGGQVAVYDISNPASPVLKGTVATGLGGIGAISLDGSHVLAGEVNGQRVALIDITNPAAPHILSVFTSAIASIAAIGCRQRLRRRALFRSRDRPEPARPGQYDLGIDRDAGLHELHAGDARAAGHLILRAGSAQHGRGLA